MLVNCSHLHFDQEAKGFIHDAWLNPTFILLALASWTPSLNIIIIIIIIIIISSSVLSLLIFFHQPEQLELEFKKGKYFKAILIKISSFKPCFKWMFVLIKVIFNKYFM